MNLTALIPTRNCASLVPGHLESMQPWLGLAGEVVIVDSDSSDGTVDALRNGISHPSVRFLNHPPGLYQSWNHGFQNAREKYVYVSTVGDSITADGIRHLVEVAEKFQSDVVISKPQFIDAAGRPLTDQRWPIDDILDRLQITAPELLTPEEQFFFALTNTWGAILGSSASNLYRADCLRRFPFPTDFGTAGDGGWGILHAFEVKIAITPNRFSTFRYHPKAYAASEYHVDSLAIKLFQTAQRVLASEREKNSRPLLESLRLPELQERLDRHLSQQRELEKSRHAPIPWIFNPTAWQARRLRNVEGRAVDRIKDEVATAFRRQRLQAKSTS